MNSEVTLTDCSMTPTSKGQVRLLFKRSDPHHAVLLENNVPRYFLATSYNLNKVKIHDATRRMVVNVNKRMLFKDNFTFVERNSGKAVPVENLLQEAPSTSDGQFSIVLHTEEGPYYWRKRRGYHWALYENSAHGTAVAWTETVPGSGPTWQLVLEERASNVLDYVLASLFYLKSSHSFTEAGKEWEGVGVRASYLSVR